MQSVKRIKDLPELAGNCIWRWKARGEKKEGKETASLFPRRSAPLTPNKYHAVQGHSSSSHQSGPSHNEDILSTYLEKQHIVSMCFPTEKYGH